jgi:preprotein translocase subunit YajC
MKSKNAKRNFMRKLNLKSITQISLITVLVNTFAFVQVAMAQADSTAATVVAKTGQEPPAWMQFVPFAVIIMVFYFFMIRPQAKKQKELQNFNQSLKIGDQVITQTGLFGKITGLSEQIANLEVSSGVQIKLLRSQISMLQTALQNNTAKKETVQS